MQTNKFRQRVFPAKVGLMCEKKNMHKSVYIGVRGRVYGMYKIRCPLEDHRKSEEREGGRFEKNIE